MGSGRGSSASRIPGRGLIRAPSYLLFDPKLFHLCKRATFPKEQSWSFMQNISIQLILQILLFEGNVLFIVQMLKAFRVKHQLLWGWVELSVTVHA